MSGGLDAPSWLDKYVTAGERVQKQHQAARDAAVAAQARMRPSTNPIVPPLPKGSPKEEARRDLMHPLLAPPMDTTTAASPAEEEVRFRHVSHHHEYHRDAEEAVKAHRDAAAAEQERLNAPHPMTQHPMASIPTPGNEQ